MTGRRSRRNREPKLCAFCGKVLVETRPTWLVGTYDGRILGPYHAICAEKLARVHKGRETPAARLGGDLYGQLPMPSAEE